MKTLKITQGKMEVIFSQDYSNEFYLIAVGDSFKNPTFGEQPHNAKLIEEAFAVANETGLTPRELLEQRNELLEALKYISDTMTSGDAVTLNMIDHLINKADKAIQNSTR